MHFTDAQFRAYARGELDYDDARLLEEAMAVEPRIARRGVAALAERRLSGAALATATEEGPALSDVDRELRPAPASTRQPRFLPLTAGVIIVLVAGSGYLAGHWSQSGAGAFEIGRPATPSLAASLGSVATGEVNEAAGGTFRAISSFQSADGTLCREFSLTDRVGDRHAVACRRAAGWAVTFALFVPRRGNDEYVPADGDDLVSSYLQHVGAGAPLSGKAERDALHRAD